MHTETSHELAKKLVNEQGQDESSSRLPDAEVRLLKLTPR
jgi:hypothetical protein